MKSHSILCLAILAMMTSLPAEEPAVSGELQISASMEQFLKEHPQATALIAIEDGKVDSSQWTTFKSKVKDGEVRVPKGEPRTKAEFGDFKLAFEFRLDPEANSGIFLRAPEEGKGKDSLCELQILDNTAEKYADLKPAQYHGSAYGLIAAKRGALNPVGEWNYQEVIVRGHRITVVLNGTTILDGDVSEIDDPKVRKSHPGMLRTRGRLVLGGHASGVYYKSMYIQPLD